MTKLKIFTLLASILMILLMVSCGKKTADSLKFKTIEVNQYQPHPNSSEDYHGFRIEIKFLYPYEFHNAEILKKLQKKFIEQVFGEKYSEMNTEEVAKKFVENWKQSYFEDLNKFDFPFGYCYVMSDTILFMSDDLLQMQTNSYCYMGGSHGASGSTALLFDLKTGNVITQNDIFKAEAANNIYKLLRTEIFKYWDFSEDENVEVEENAIWSPQTNFAITTEGINFMYSDYELGCYAFGGPYITINYDKILPFLRPNTPVWKVAQKHSNKNDKNSTKTTEKETIKDIAMRLADRIPEINRNFEVKLSGENKDEFGATNTWTDEEKQNYLYFYTEEIDAVFDRLQMRKYERKNAAKDLVVVNYINEGEDPYHKGLRWFEYDRKTGALTTADQPFSISTPTNLDIREGQNWHFDYHIATNGNILVNAILDLEAGYYYIVKWDNEKETFTLYDRAISYCRWSEKASEDNDETEKYLQETLLPNFQRINNIEHWTWTHQNKIYLKYDKNTWEDAKATYYYSAENGLEKVDVSIAHEGKEAFFEYYILNNALSFVYHSVYKNRHLQLERKWYLKDGNDCFRGIGDNDIKLTATQIENEFLKGEHTSAEAGYYFYPNFYFSNFWIILKN